ncbi:MAG: hypothetical protein ACRCYY_20965 [Trueperaceae bacterium]
MATTNPPFFKAQVYWQLQRLYNDLAKAGTPLTEKRQLCLEGVLAGFSYEQIANVLTTLEPTSPTKQNNLYKVKNRMEHTRTVLEKFFLAPFDRVEDIPKQLEHYGYHQTAWTYLLSTAAPNKTITLYHLERGPQISAPHFADTHLPRVLQHALVQVELKPSLPFVVLLSGDASGKVWSLSPSSISPDAPFKPNNPIYLPKFKEQTLWFSDIGVETFLLIESSCELGLTQDWKMNEQNLYILRQEAEDLDKLLEALHVVQHLKLETRLSYMQFEVVPKV